MLLGIYVAVSISLPIAKIHNIMSKDEIEKKTHVVDFVVDLCTK